MNERIKELRKTLGLTLDKFGERVGLRKSSLSQIENGVNGVTEQLIKSVCREFHVREEWLRTGEEPMFIQMSREEEERQRQKDYIHLVHRNGMTVYEISGIPCLKNMLEMGDTGR